MRKLLQKSYPRQKTRDLASKSYCWSPNLLGTPCLGAATISSSGALYSYRGYKIKPSVVLSFLISQVVTNWVFCVGGPLTPGNLDNSKLSRTIWGVIGGHGGTDMCPSVMGGNLVISGIVSNTSFIYERGLKGTVSTLKCIQYGPPV